MLMLLTYQHCNIFCPPPPQVTIVTTPPHHPRTCNFFFYRLCLFLSVVVSVAILTQKCITTSSVISVSTFSSRPYSCTFSCLQQCHPSSERMRRGLRERVGLLIRVWASLLEKMIWEHLQFMRSWLGGPSAHATCQTQFIHPFPILI